MFFGSVVIVIVVVTVFFGFAAESKPTEPIPLYISSDYSGKNIKGPVNVNDIDANSSHYFYYPEPTDNTDRDVQEQFLLIRLPAALGGEKDDVSAFRAYSALDPGSSCLVKYWPEPDRQRIEDPCRSPPYRAIDGISMVWPNGTFFGKPTTGALPQLDLTIDNTGQLYVMPPTFTADKNGIVGSGRDITPQEFEAGTELLKKIQKEYDEKMSSFHLPEKLPTGHTMFDIYKKNQYKWRVNYFDSERKLDGTSITYEFCDCVKTFEEFVKEQWTQVKYVWNVNDTYIYALPNKVDYGNGVTDEYKFTFYVDGFRVEFRTNMQFEEGMNVVLENYFPEKTIDNLVNMGN